MTGSPFRRNHYVPVWYQRRFIPTGQKEQKYFYLDLKPENVVSGIHRYKRKSILKWGLKKCFCEHDLYTTRFGEWESTEIEEKFFGGVEKSGLSAIDYFSKFKHPSANGDLLNAFVPYMSIQKLRTPKGLANLSQLTNLKEKNEVLTTLQQLQTVYCAIWSECIWSIADASDSDTKFIVSDHPITIYNKGCFPESKWCRDSNDPDIRLIGSHTLFPLDLNKILILTNLSYVRNPYQSPLRTRPNPNFFRTTLFNFMQIQINRILSEIEVNEINYIIKQRAHRYIAAGKKEWLFPEEKIPKKRWDCYGDEYLLMPDPRSVTFSTETIIGYENDRSDSYDAYGRKPGHTDYDDKNQSDYEWITFHAFQGEFARKFGPRRKGLSHELGSLDKVEDDPDYHEYHLKLEGKHKAKMKKKKMK